MAYTIKAEDKGSHIFYTAWEPTKTQATPDAPAHRITEGNLGRVDLRKYPTFEEFNNKKVMYTTSKEYYAYNNQVRAKEEADQAEALQAIYTKYPTLETDKTLYITGHNHGQLSVYDRSYSQHTPITKYEDPTETAKKVRAALKAKFPGVKFSVRTDKYSGGSSLDIRWEDGPLQKDVEPVCNYFKGASFDGMQDLKSTVHYSWEENGYKFRITGADYIFCTRDISAGHKAKIESYMLHNLGYEKPDQMSYNDDREYYRLFKRAERLLIDPEYYNKKEAAQAKAWEEQKAKEEIEAAKYKASSDRHRDQFMLGDYDFYASCIANVSGKMINAGSIIITFDHVEKNNHCFYLLPEAWQSGDPSKDLISLERLDTQYPPHYIFSDWQYYAKKAYNAKQEKDQESEEKITKPEILEEKQPTPPAMVPAPEPQSEEPPAMPAEDTKESEIAFDLDPFADLLGDLDLDLEQYSIESQEMPAMQESPEEPPEEPPAMPAEDPAQLPAPPLQEQTPILPPLAKVKLKRPIWLKPGLASQSCSHCQQEKDQAKAQADRAQSKYLSDRLITDLLGALYV